MNECEECGDKTGSLTALLCDYCKREIEDQIDILEIRQEDIGNHENIEGYEEMLDETKEQWIKTYDGATALKEIDPTAYNCGLNDYYDAELSEIENTLVELKDKLGGQE